MSRIPPSIIVDKSLKPPLPSTLLLECGRWSRVYSGRGDVTISFFDERLVLYAAGRHQPRVTTRQMKFIIRLLEVDVRTALRDGGNVRFVHDRALFQCRPVTSTSITA